MDTQTIDNTRTGIGNGNEITRVTSKCFVGFLRLLPVTTVHLSVCNE